MTTTATATLQDSLRPPADLPYDLTRAWNQGVLLQVVTGSHLHGFATPTSDHDTWVVVPEPRDRTGSWAAKKVWQNVERCPDGPDTDVTVVGLSTWLRYCDQGIPQALDVMFAAGDVVTRDTIPHLRAAYRANPNTATPSFRRMIDQIVQHRADIPKQRRHAFRLALNLTDLTRTGRYQPRLTPQQRDQILILAAQEDGFVERLEAFSGLTFDTSRAGTPAPGYDPAAAAISPRR